MGYFIILPLFIFSVLLMSVCSILCAVVPSWRRMSPFAWRILVWSSLGCILANIPILGLYLLPWALQQLGVVPGQGVGSSALKYVFMACLLIGPFVASAGGYAGGVVFAVRAATRAIRTPDRPRRVTGEAV